MGQGQGREQLPFDIGENFTSLSGRSIWSVHAGRRKADGEPVTVFVFEFTDKSEEEIKLVRSAHLRLKTLRHPNILRYIDGVELPHCIYLVTEEAVPLEDHLREKEGYSDFSLSWGLHQTIKAIGFLSVDCGLVHRNICLSSVFVDGAGEWKLGGVEFMHQFSDPSVPRKTLEGLKKYDPPELNKPAAARRAEKWSTDIWGLGCLVWEIFNGPLTQVSALRNTAKIPKSLVPHYCEMVGANPKSRPSPSDLLSRLREHRGYLSNQFVSIALRIEEVQIMEPSQRNDFFIELNKSLDSFPERFAKRKILPQLLNAFEFGGAGSAVLAPLFKLGRLLEDSEYQKKIVPCVVKLFSSTDRATRLNLLQQLENFIDHLQPSTVNDQIFPNVATGFTDTVPALREQTIKSMLQIAPKLSGATLNTQLLKYMAKCQLDEQPGIRTNTTVCLGKIASHLNPSTRHKVLVSAFLRALKDPFPPARCAGITAMAVTHGYYLTGDIATRLLPSLCTMTIDKDKSVRDQAFQVIKLFLGKLERISDNPEVAAEQQKAEAAASSWTGWAMSSLTSKFYRSAPTTATGTTAAPSVSAPGKTEARKEPTKLDTEKQGTREKGSVVSERREPAAVEQSRPQEDEEGGWDDGEWEDFTMVSSESQQQQERGEGSDMEGWEDDGWGTFETTPDQPISSGADFFENFKSNVSPTEKDKNEDFFQSFGAPLTSGHKKMKERSPPPPVSASLFEGDSGWGDWGSDFSSAPSHEAQKKTTGGSTAAQPGGGKTQPGGGKSQPGSGKGMKLGTTKEPPLFTMATSGSTSPSGLGEAEGWDFGSDWGSFDTPPAKTTTVQKQSQRTSLEESSGVSRQEILQKKREERRLKQQAAREKRAAGVAVRPGGLGAVKKD